MNTSRIKVIAEGALCVALSVALGYLTLFRMPQGGSINLELTPLLVFAYRHGWKWGVEVGALYGFLHLFLGGYIVHPVQALLDYPLAYGMIGFVGIWRKNLIALIAGTILAGLAYYCCHVTSGVVFFSSYAPKGANVLLYSAVYNSTDAIKLAINAAIALLIFKRLEKAYPSA